jgi:hypothetical protein
MPIYIESTVLPVVKLLTFFGKWLVRISDGTPAILRFFFAFPQFLQTSSGIVHQIRPRPLPFKSFQIHYPPIILPVDTINSGLLTASSINHKSNEDALNQHAPQYNSHNNVRCRTQYEIQIMWEVSEVAHERINRLPWPSCSAFIYPLCTNNVQKMPPKMDRHWKIIWDYNHCFFLKPHPVPKHKSKFPEPSATVCWGSPQAILRLRVPWHSIAASDLTINKESHVS